MYPGTLLFIDGVWREGSGRRTIDVVNPATGDTIGQVAHAGIADLDEALAAAAKGFRHWRKVSALERGKVLRRAGDLLRQRVDVIAEIMTLEQGKPIAEARMELLMSADILDWCAEEGRRAYGRLIPARTPGVTQSVTREPVGPVAAFTPWNFPVSQVARKVAAALSVGCSMILKAPEETPASPAELVRALADAGLPAGVLNLVYGTPAENLRIPGPASDDPQGVVHGLGAGRQASGGARRQPYETRHDGTRRPRPRDGVRGRRHRGRERHPGGVEVPQCRPGLRVADALPGAGTGTR